MNNKPETPSTGAREWLLWEEVANPASLYKRTTSVEVGRAISKILADTPDNSLVLVCEAYANYKLQEVAKKAAREISQEFLAPLKNISPNSFEIGVEAWTKFIESAIEKAGKE